jgi:cytochrome c oxidase subunit III
MIAMQQTTPNEPSASAMSSAAAAQAGTKVDHKALQHHEEHEHGDMRLFGFTVFLISETMLFLGLFSALLTYRSVAPVWPPAGTPELEKLLPAINTVILIASSLVIHQASDAIKKNNLKAVRQSFLLTLLMGATFLAGQLWEYAHLSFGLKSGIFGSTFYVLTGFHGLHVFVGLLLMATVIFRSMKPKHYTAESHFGIEATSLYWHFVDVVWIFLFLLLYVI